METLLRTRLDEFTDKLKAMDGVGRTVRNFMKLSRNIVSVFLLLLLVSPIINSQEKNSSTLESNFFTSEQEKYLAEHPHVYAYFSQLYTGNKKTPKQIAEEYQLSPKTTHQYLKALADIRVIVLPKENDLESPIQFLVKGVSGFAAYGPLSVRFTEEMFKQHFEKTMKLITKQQQEGASKKEGEGLQQDYFLSAAGFWLTNVEYEQYQKEIKNINEKYINISGNNLNTKKPDIFRVSIISNAVPHWEPELFTNIKTEF